MKLKKYIVRYMMLLAGIILLLSVVVPHHHHNDGMPCYISQTTETEEGEHSNESHDCGCNGHNIALYTSLLSHTTDGDVTLFLFPLQILFDYFNPPVLSFVSQVFERERGFYIESLHDSWIVCIGGLRAPPVL